MATHGIAPAQAARQELSFTLNEYVLLLLEFLLPTASYVSSLPSQVESTSTPHASHLSIQCRRCSIAFVGLI
ncbi:hypothetical protein CEP52_013692 [Fusarium oligoseptatum]|nr:hypothetical protein CEP52_013692 [Fusarium oligoseptatum]